jgi:hypothetical protein
MEHESRKVSGRIASGAKWIVLLVGELRQLKEQSTEATHSFCVNSTSLCCCGFLLRPQLSEEPDQIHPLDSSSAIFQSAEDLTTPTSLMAFARPNDWSAQMPHQLMSISYQARP